MSRLSPDATGTLLDKLADNANTKLYVTKFSKFSIFLTKLFVTKSFAIASLVTYSEIHQKQCGHDDFKKL